MCEPLTGQVCQLNYQGGGILDYQSQQGTKKHIPFSSAQSLFLRVGQTVCFWEQQTSNGVEAMNLHLPRGNRCSSPKRPPHDGHLNSKIWQKQIWRLQHRMAAFRNAEHWKQLELVQQAETLLKTLLQQAELDGDAICRLVRKCSSWLTVPILHLDHIDSKQRDTAASKENEAGSLQWRVREILITALNHLDLSDVATFKAVEAALCYVSALLQRLDKKVTLLTCQARQRHSCKQWLQLRELLGEMKPKEYFFLGHQKISQEYCADWLSLPSPSQPVSGKETRMVAPTPQHLGFQSFVLKRCYSLSLPGCTCFS